jgi:hypothetical protein
MEQNYTDDQLLNTCLPNTETVEDSDPVISKPRTRREPRILDTLEYKGESIEVTDNETPFWVGGYYHDTLEAAQQFIDDYDAANK